MKLPAVSLGWKGGQENCSQQREFILQNYLKCCSTDFKTNYIVSFERSSIVRWLEKKCTSAAGENKKLCSSHKQLPPPLGSPTTTYTTTTPPLWCPTNSFNSLLLFSLLLHFSLQRLCQASNIQTSVLFVRIHFQKHRHHLCRENLMKDDI